MSTLNFSGTAPGSTWKRSNRRNSAHGPSVITSGPLLPSALLRRITEATRVLGQLTVTDGPPVVSLCTWPSTSSASSFRLGSSSDSRISMRIAGTLPPARKKTSRMRCARWNSTSEADDIGLLPSPSGR